MQFACSLEQNTVARKKLLREVKKIYCFTSLQKMTKVRNFTLPIFAVNRPVTISMVFISLIVLGFISLKRIPLEMMPQGFSSTSMTISTPYPNSSVDEIIKKIVIPLEKEIKTISGITNFYSRINENRARTRIKFSGTQNLDELYPILKERLDRILPEMPDDFEKFYIYKRNDDSSPIAWLSLSLENYSEEQLSSLLERIEAGFSRIKGVAKVNIFGVSEKQVIIQFNQKKIMNYRISIEKVIQDLQKDNFNLASGKITDSKKEWYLKSVATFQSKKELEDRKIGYGDLKLKDIAEVKYTYPERLWRNLLDGKRAMTIAVYRESGANTIEVSERLQLYTASIAKNPQMKNIKFIFLMLQSKFIKDGLSNLLETAGWGAIFAFITLFFFLRRIRLTIIIITAVPFSILMTLIFMDFMGRSINIISLMGFMVGVGMLVDNSVVVVENIARLQMEGLEKKDAVIQGTSEVSISIILSTLTTVVVFLPAMFLGDGGQLRFIMIHLGVPIVVSLVASLFVAMLFIPFGSIFLIKKKQEQEPQYILWLQKHYYSILKWSLNHKYQTFWLLLLIIALTIIPAKNLKMSAFGSGNIVSVSTWFQFPPDWDTADVSKYFSQIEKVVHAQRKKLGIKNSYVWHSNRRGRLRLFLVDKEQQPIPPKQLLKKLKTLIPVVAGVTFRIQGRGTQDDNQGLEIQIYGSDQNQLKILAQQMIEHLETLSGVSELSESTETLDQEAVIHIDVEKAKNLGLTPQAIARQISFTIRGISNLPSINLQGKEIKMVAQLRKEDREGLETLRTMTFFSEKKEAIKL
ncbi:MAG: HAE1 family hydrophobic/amphiphilic exporter-1, partial [bacterium]